MLQSFCFSCSLKNLNLSEIYFYNSVIVLCRVYYFIHRICASWDTFLWLCKHLVVDILSTASTFQYQLKTFFVAFFFSFVVFCNKVRCNCLGTVDNLTTSGSSTIMANWFFLHCQWLSGVTYYQWDILETFQYGIYCDFYRMSLDSDWRNFTSSAITFSFSSSISDKVSNCDTHSFWFTVTLPFQNDHSQSQSNVHHKEK